MAATIRYIRSTTCNKNLKMDASGTVALADPANTRAFHWSITAKGHQGAVFIHSESGNVQFLTRDGTSLKGASTTSAEAMWWVIQRADNARYTIETVDGPDGAWMALICKDGQLSLTTDTSEVNPHGLWVFPEDMDSTATLLPEESVHQHPALTPEIIAAIVIGCIFAVILIVLVLYYGQKWWNQNQRAIAKE